MKRMEFYPAEFLVFTGVYISTQHFLFFALKADSSLFVGCTDESAFCDKDLLQSLARLPQGTPSEGFLADRNAAYLSLLPAIEPDRKSVV